MRKSSYIILIVNIISIGIGMYVLRHNQVLIANYAIDGSGYIPLDKSNLILIGLIPFIVVGTMDLIATLEPDEVKPFIKHYDRLKFLVCFAFQLLYILIIISQVLSVNDKLIRGSVLAIVIYYVGYTLSHISHNQTVGFKNRWTLSNPSVWTKVHLRAQKLLYCLAIIVIFMTFFQTISLTSLVVGLSIIIIGYLIYYSYNESKKSQYVVTKDRNGAMND